MVKELHRTGSKNVVFFLFLELAIKQIKSFTVLCQLYFVANICVLCCFLCHLSVSVSHNCTNRRTLVSSVAFAGGDSGRGVA